MTDAAASSDASAAYSHDRRIILYPAYINSKIATSKGRKMPIAHCCDSPTVFEMVEVLKHLGYENPVIEVHTQPAFSLCAAAQHHGQQRLTPNRDRLPGRTKRILAAIGPSVAACVCSLRTPTLATSPSRTLRRVRLTCLALSPVTCLALVRSVCVDTERRAHAAAAQESSS